MKQRTFFILFHITSRMPKAKQYFKVKKQVLITASSHKYEVHLSHFNDHISL